MSYQPRSTNPYIMEKKLNECVGGGGFDPSVLEEIQAEISVLGSENAAMAQDIIDIKGSLNTINDNLNNWIKYKDVSFDNVTFTDKVYIDIESSKPTIQGYTMAIAVVLSASATLSSPGDYPAVEANGNYLIGTIGKTYARITVRYLYVHDEIH